MLVVKGAREHNLKGVDVSIPRGSLTTITGVSGSGKSSLAFDTIYREGQRRFLESLSSYARQFLGGIDRPKVDHVDGLSPAVSIDQKTVSRNPRSTVGTITEIYDYLRLLYARLGTPGCPKCGRAVAAQTSERIVERILADHRDRKAILLAPIVRDRKGEYRKELDTLLRDGFVRARVNGEIVELKPGMRLERYKRHTIEAVMDRVVVSEGARGRITEAVERALDKGQGFMNLLVDDALQSFLRFLHCVDCGIDLPEIEPRLVLDRLVKRRTMELGGTAAMAVSSRSGLRDATGDGAGGDDLKSMKINTTEGAGGVTHTVTVCFEGNCPAAGSITIVKLGDAEVKIRSAGGTAEVSKKPKGASSYSPYELVNWDDHDDYCCITLTWTEAEAGNPGGASKEFEFSAECPGGDRMPDTGGGTHGW